VRRISLDALLLAALAAAGIAEALGDDTLTSPDRVTGVVATVLAVAWLAYRRRAPVAVFVAVGVLCGAWVAIAYGWEQGPFAGFLFLLVAAFALGLHGRGRAPLVAFVVLMGLGMLRDASGLARGLERAGDVVPSYIFFVTAFVAGIALHRRELLATLLGERAERAERERELRAREAVADERARIARELHDVVAHDVSVMVVQAQGAARVLEGEQPQVRQALAAIETTGREAVDDMRRLLGVLPHGRRARARAPAVAGRARGAGGRRPRGGPAGRARGRGGAGRPAPGRRPERLPHRAGGVDQRAQARRSRARPRRRALRG
jgi:signal transduction histidine kinase